MSQSPEKAEMKSLHRILFLIFASSVIYKYYTSTTPIVVEIEDPEFSTLGPYNTTEIEVDDNYTQLIDLRNFKFISNPQPCKMYSAGLLVVVIVSSNPSNYENRQVIRNTWGKSLESMKVVFLMGESDNVSIATAVRNESKVYKDIVQGNFRDVYRNLTYKHAMGLKWVTHHCNTAKYVLKTDDDVFANSRGLRHFFTKQLSPWGATNLITCPVLDNAKAQRSADSKWMVTTDEYPSKYYPPYCAGWAVIYSQDVIPRLLKTVQSLPYFWIDDVHITGICAQKIGVTQTPLSRYILKANQMKMMLIVGYEYFHPFIFGPPDLNPQKIKEMWKTIPE